MMYGEIGVDMLDVKNLQDNIPDLIIYRILLYVPKLQRVIPWVKREKKVRINNKVATANNKQND